MHQVPRDYNFIKRLPTEVKEDARAIAGVVREPLLLLDRELFVAAASRAFYEVFELEPREAEGRLLFSLCNFLWDRPVLREALKTELREGGGMEDLKVELSCGEGESHFLLNIRTLGRSGPDADLILISFEKIIKEQELVEKRERYFKGFEDIIAHAPAFICMFRGPEHIFEVTNENYLRLIGGREIIGKTVREALPEKEYQVFFDILDKAYRTGEPFVGNEVPITIGRGEDDSRLFYLNFLYQPTFNKEGLVDGLFVYAIDVTEQVLARKKVEESENRLKEVIDTVPAIFWISTREGSSTYLNENWYEFTGQAEEEAEGLGWIDSIHPEDRELAENAFLQANEEQGIYSVSYRLRTKNGKYRWVADRGRPRFFNGQYEGMIGTLVDVQEEKIKEELLREKEHRIRSIVEEATVATAVYIGEEMRIELANDAMIQLWGKDQSVIGQPLSEAIPELQGQPFHQLLQEVYSTGQTYWGKEDPVSLVIGDDLQQGFYNFTYKPLRNERGEIYGVLNMAMDVTETVESKALIKESESHLRQMADLMPEKVSTCDAEGNFIYFNQGWIDYTGLSSDELRKWGWNQFVHPEEQEPFRERWQRSLETGADFEMELRCTDRNGFYKWHLNRAEAVRDEDGNIKMWISTNTEIQRLKEEEKRKENFLKMVSHELKTPVTSIKGYIQLLLGQLGKEENVSKGALPLRASLERIDYQILRLTRLISEMLDLSRIKESKLELKMETFSLNELVTETVQDISYTNTRHNIQIFHDLDCHITADRDRIGQVLINFITNAIKYSPGSREVEVRINDAGNEQVRVSVKDWGIGIDRKNHRNIFKRFYRIGGKSEETYSGFGIGLYLADEIIERHNGIISVKSEKGKGSEFSFTLAVTSIRNQ